MKPRVSPNFSLFQIVLQDYKHRRPSPNNGFYVDKSGRGVRDVVETVPLITKLKWAKTAKRAMKWAKKFGSVISCRKVDSHIRRCKMIEYLRVEPKPIEVDISPEEFIIGRDLKITPIKKDKRIDVNGT